MVAWAGWAGGLAVSDPGPIRAARSVHLGWMSPAANRFYLELAVDRSVPGSYFMVCGWHVGYFGVQELADGRKVVLFSVWDDARGDDPDAVPLEHRVEVLAQGEGVRIRRFGGEGTGAQAMMDWEWRPGQTNRFLVAAMVEGERTRYSGYLWSAQRSAWLRLVTFRTRSGGRPLTGLYSFVEDFRRDGRSAGEERRARFFRGWVRCEDGSWFSLRRARFTASEAEWESRDNVDAGVVDGQFYLATGGAVHKSRELGSVLEVLRTDTAPPADLPSEIAGQDPSAAPYP